MQKMSVARAASCCASFNELRGCRSESVTNVRADRFVLQALEMLRLPDVASETRWNTARVRVSNTLQNVSGVTAMATHRRHATFAMIVYAGLATALFPTLVHAGTPDEQFDCTSNPHRFISALIDAKSIDPQPTHVEANSVNAFKPAHGAGLHAFGFPIYAVFGYEPDDSLFRQGSGKTVDGPVYGVVVSAPAEPVRTRVEQANSRATVRPVVPLLLTAIVCDGQSAPMSAR